MGLPIEGEQLRSPFKKTELTSIQPLQPERPWWQSFTKRLIDYKPLRGALAGVMAWIGTHGTPPNIVSAEPLPQQAGQEAVLGEASVLEPAALIAIADQEFNQKEIQLRWMVGEALGLSPNQIQENLPLGKPYTITYLHESVIPNQSPTPIKVFGNLVFQLDENGHTALLPAISEIEKKLDQDNKDKLKLLPEGQLGGDIIPLKSNLQAITVSQTLTEQLSKLLSKLSQVFGTPLDLTGAISDKGIFRVGNTTEDYFTLVQNPDTNQLRLGNIAIALINSGAVPQTVLLSPTEAGIGGGTTPSPQETTKLPAELYETTPQGRLATEKFPEGTPGWKPRQESADKTDQFFNESDSKVIFKHNPQLRGGVGTNTLWPDLNNRRGNQWYGLLNSFVDPDDPKTLIVEFNITKPDLKLDEATRDSIERQAAGAIGLGLSKVIYGKSTLDETLTQDQHNRLGQRAVQLQNIRPLELIAPTAS